MGSCWGCCDGKIIEVEIFNVAHKSWFARDELWLE